MLIDLKGDKDKKWEYMIVDSEDIKSKGMFRDREVIMSSQPIILINVLTVEPDKQKEMIELLVIEN